MITGAALLVLLGAALFAAGLLTGDPAWYWACVAVCAGAAVLIALARRSLRRGPAGAPVGTDAERASAPVAAATSATDLPVPTAATGQGAGEREPDPPVEEVEVPDLLVVVDLTDEVLVVDEQPRYHVAGCGWLQERSTIALPVDEARTDGFTPCGVCRPDRTLAARARARRTGG